MADATTTYSGQGSTGLVGAQLVALLRCEPTDELVAAMWPSVVRGDLPTLLIVLTGRLASLPDFALVQVRDGKTTVFARGSIQVEVFHGDRPIETIVAGMVTTWQERSFSGADRVLLTSSGGGAGKGLPLLGGVVTAGRLEHTLGAGPQSFALPAPQPPIRDLGEAEVPKRLPQTPHTQSWSDPDESPKAPVEPLHPVPMQLRSSLDRPSIVEERPAPPPSRLLPDRIGLATYTRDTEESSLRKPVPQGPRFVAVRCPKLHLNEPATPACRECYLPLDPDAEQTMVEQPPLVWLHRLGTRERWELVKPVTLLGSSPGPAPIDCLSVSLSGVSDAVSNVHIEVRLRGFRVEVVDRSGRGGTTVVNPDGRQTRLEPGTPLRLLENGRIVLPDGVTLIFEVKP